MKLQITDVKAKRIAQQLGACSPTLTEDVVRVLATLRDERLDPLTRRDVTAVLNAMGWETTSAHAWKDIGTTIEARCEKAVGAGRGFYTQGQPPAAAFGAKLQEAIMQNGEAVEVVKRAGLAWRPEALDIDVAAEGYYGDDTGLRRMAIADSSCYGVAHSPIAPACKTCPLARYCAKASVSAMSDIAAALDRETEAEIKLAELRAAEAAKPKVGPVKVEGPKTEVAEPTKTEPKTEDTKPVDTGATSDAVAVTAALVARYGAGNFTEIPLPFEGVCGHCDKTIDKDYRATHIPGQGMQHSHCALAK